MAKLFRVICCQFDIAWEDKAANFATVERMAASAGLQPGDLLLLPEMLATGFSMNAAQIVEPLDGPTARFLAQLARQHAVYVVGGVAIQQATGAPTNEALVFEPRGSLLSHYAKVHLFSPGAESVHYAAGAVAGRLALAECTAQVAICYDLRFPELFRGTGPVAELLLVIADWPAVRADHWSALLTARAIENQAYVAAVNRCGTDPHVSYSGGSQIIDPRGKVIAEAGNGECVIAARLDLEGLREYRQNFPVLGDR